MAAPWQVFHRSVPTSGALGTPLHNEFLYGPPTLYYLEEMQCCGCLLSLRRILRSFRDLSNPLVSTSFSSAAGSCAGAAPVSPSEHA